MFSRCKTQALLDVIWKLYFFFVVVGFFYADTEPYHGIIQFALNYSSYWPCYRFIDIFKCWTVLISLSLSTEVRKSLGANRESPSAVSEIIIVL